MYKFFLIASFLVTLGVLTGCATQGGEITKLTETAYDPYFADHKVDMFFDKNLPDRPYIEIALLEAKSDPLGMNKADHEKAIEFLKDQCRRAGGDAIIKIKTNKTGHFETSTYHVTARAIRYTDN